MTERHLIVRHLNRKLKKHRAAKPSPYHSDISGFYAVESVLENLIDEIMLGKYLDEGDYPNPTTVERLEEQIDLLLESEKCLHIELGRMLLENERRVRQSRLIGKEP